MNMVANKDSMRRGWTPAPMKFFSGPKRGPALGESGLSDSLVLSLMTDVAATATSAVLAWNLYAQNSRWGTFWWVVSGISAIKTINDASKA